MISIHEIPWTPCNHTMGGNGGAWPALAHIAPTLTLSVGAHIEILLDLPVDFDFWQTVLTIYILIKVGRVVLRCDFFIA